jgi:hypothetical protein
MTPEISIQKVQVSSVSKSCDKPDSSALVPDCMCLLLISGLLEVWVWIGYLMSLTAPRSEDYPRTVILMDSKGVRIFSVFGLLES